MGWLYQVNAQERPASGIRLGVFGSVNGGWLF
jgi:hypothetical protein